MYHTWIDGKEFTAEKLQWVKLQDNGIYVSCDEAEGQGVVLGGEIYHVEGRKPLERPTVTLIWQEDAPRIKDTVSIAFAALAQAQILDDVTIAEHAEEFALWNFPVTYKQGQICRFRGTLYRCVQDHISEQDWTPEAAASLWTVIGDPGVEWPAWAQPVGAHDVYKIGDKVNHGDKHWVSCADDNVWEPGVYGWTEVAE